MSLTRDQKAMKTTTRKLVDECGGPVACSQLLDGKSSSLISAYGNPDDSNRPPRFMPLSDIAALERFAGRSVVGAWLVERIKRDPDRPIRTLSHDDLPRMAKELSDAMNALVEAKSDGKICAADRVNLRREFREVVDLFLDLIDAAEESR